MKFSDLEYVPPVLTSELPDLQERAIRAARTLGVTGPLRYLGAGAEGVVFADDAAGIVLKVGRVGPPTSRYRPELERQKRVDFLAEYEYAMDAVDRDLPVAAPIEPGFLPSEMTLVKELIVGKPATMATRGLSDLWKMINDAMTDRWGPVEFKEENFVVSKRGFATLVDCAAAVRRGANLLAHAELAARGVIDDPDAECRGKDKDESYLRWSLRMDALDGRISDREASRVIAELDARYGTPRQRNPSKPPCRAGVHQKALEDDAVWATWPLLIIDKQMGIETRRCPDCHSTQSRLLPGFEENPRRRQRQR